MGLILFLIGRLEFYLSLCTECLYSDFNIIFIFVLWLILVFLIFFMRIPSIPTLRKNECIQDKHESRVKRRRKGGTRRGSAYYQSDEEEERKLIDFLKSPLGWNHNSSHFRQLLCPDPSCDTCNNATAEINRIFSKALEGSTPSVSPAVSTAPVTEPSFHQSSAFPEVPLTQPSPSPPSVLPLNSLTTSTNSRSSSPACQTLPTEPSSHSESEFPVQNSPIQTDDLYSSNLTHSDFHQKLSDIHSTKISSVEDSAPKLRDPTKVSFLSPDKHDSVVQDSYPKTLEYNLKQEVFQFFWGLPSLHSESLLSAAHVSGYHSTFNSISNVFISQGSSELPYFLPSSLPKVQPQLLPQPLPLCHYLPLTQLQPRVHLQSPLPMLPAGLINQTKSCGVHCHTPLNESECLTSSDIEELESNVVKKEKESLLSLPSLDQSSWEAFYPLTPTSPYGRPSKALTSTSIDHFEYPLSVEFRKKFEHHLRKRLIQHRWGLPLRIHESLSLMKPRCECSKIPKSTCCNGLSWISTYKANGSTIPNRVTPSEEIYKKGPEMFQLSEDMTDSLDSYPKGMLSDTDRASDQDLGDECDMKSVTRQSVSQRQLVNIQKVHVNKNFEEITESHLPGTVQIPLHCIQHILSEEPKGEIRQRSLPPSVGGDYCLNKCQEPSFLEASALETLEDHNINFPMKTLGGLPAKIIESIEDFKSNGSISHSLTSAHSSSSTKVISEVSTESGNFTLLKGSSESLHSDLVRIENLAPVLNPLFSAISLVNKEGQGIQHRLSEDFHTIPGGEPPPLPVTNTIHGEISQNPPLTGNIQPSELPARQANRESAPNYKSVNSIHRTQMIEATNSEEAKPAPMSIMTREIASAEELYAVQSVTTSKPGISQKKNRHSTVTTEKAPSKISDPSPNLSELRKQLIDEMKLKLERRKHSQAQGHPKDMSSDSDSLTDKASLTPAKCVSSVNKEVHQVLYVHSEDSAVPMEKQQESWLPRHVLSSCQDQNFPPGVKKDNACPPPKTTGPKYEELGGGDARVIICQPRRKRFPPQVTAVEDMYRSKSLHSLSQKGQAPPDSLFINKMKSLFQRLRPSITWTMQETTQEMAGHISSAQSRGPVKSRADFTGTMQVPSVMSDTGECPEEKRGHSHAGATTCPQEPLPSAVQSGKALQKGAVQARVKSMQGCDLNHRAPFSNVTNMKSGLQAAISDDQRSTSIRPIRKEDRSHSKAVTFKDQQVYQKDPQSVSLKGTLPHPSPTCRPQAAMGRPAVPSTAGGTAFKNRSQPFRHTMLLYNFQGETLPAPK